MDRTDGAELPQAGIGLVIVLPGAFADLLVVQGNPLDDIGLLENPQKNFAAIMKGGRIYKNVL